MRETAAGTMSGALLSYMSIPSWASIDQTIVLAIIGAVVGFLTTIVCKRVYYSFFPKTQPPGKINNPAAPKETNT